MTNQYLIIIILILSSCGNDVSKSEIARTTNSTTQHKIEPKVTENNKKESHPEKIDTEEISIYSTDSLTRADSTDLDSLRNRLPLSWERFGLENEDTVTYSFCGA